MALTKLYLWSKKLCQFITNLFFLAQYNTTHRRISHPDVITESYLPLQYYIPTEVYTKKARKNNSAISSLQEQARLNVLTKKIKGSVVQFIAISLLTSEQVESFLDFAKISYKTQGPPPSSFEKPTPPSPPPTQLGAQFPHVLNTFGKPCGKPQCLSFLLVTLCDCVVYYKKMLDEANRFYRNSSIDSISFVHFIHKDSCSFYVKERPITQ